MGETTTRTVDTSAAKPQAPLSAAELRELQASICETCSDKLNPILTDLRDMVFDLDERVGVLLGDLDETRAENARLREALETCQSHLYGCRRVEEMLLNSIDEALGVEEPDDEPVRPSLEGECLVVNRAGVKNLYESGWHLTPEPGDSD